MLPVVIFIKAFQADLFFFASHSYRAPTLRMALAVLGSAGELVKGSGGSRLGPFHHGHPLQLSQRPSSWAAGVGTGQSHAAGSGNAVRSLLRPGPGGAGARLQRLPRPAGTTPR